jgi:hypothetical protein
VSPNHAQKLHVCHVKSDDVRTRVSELRCIAKQVVEHLNKARLVAVDVGEAEWHIVDELQGRERVSESYD